MTVMKKLLLLLALVFVMCGCKQYITNYGVVEKVELQQMSFVNGYESKYIVTVGENFNGIWKAKVVIYTNDLYQIGDTIQITKRN